MKPSQPPRTREEILPPPHDVYALSLSGVVEEVVLSRAPHGGVQSLLLLIAHTWYMRSRMTPPVVLPGGRELNTPPESVRIPRVTHYSVSLVGDRIGPLVGYLDAGLQGLVVDLWGTPTGGNFQGGRDVVLVRDARVIPSAAAQLAGPAT